MFLLVIVSGGGDDDLEIDTDADLDTDADFDTDTTSDFSFVQVLGWLGIGKAPLLLLLATDFSLWGVLGWMFNVWFGKVADNFLGGLILFFSMFLSLLIGGIIAQPIGKIFAEFGEDTSSDRLVGCIGTVSSTFIPKENQGRIGQVDVIDRTGNLITINATLPEWTTIIPQRGEKVIVIEQHLRNYSIITQNSLDQERWLNNKG